MHGYEFFHGGAGKHFNFFQLPEDLVFNDCFKELSTDAKVLYCIMLKRVGLSYKHGWMDSAGRTYIIYTLEEAMRVFRCANQKATKLFNELEAVGLIEKIRQGQGKPDLVYVKDFATPVDSVDNSFQTHEESQVKIHENHDSGVMKSRIQDSWNPGASNRNNSLIRYNVILTATERLTMSNRPKNPANARNKNVLIVGGSGSGKTRFWLKPNLLQMHSSYVVTDPKGSILVECGYALQKIGKYEVKVFNTINFSKSMHYNRATCSPPKMRRTALFSFSSVN